MFWDCYKCFKLLNLFPAITTAMKYPVGPLPHIFRPPMTLQHSMHRKHHSHKVLQHRRKSRREFHYPEDQVI